MSCLIYASDGQGRCVGKCDATCYDAEGPDCDCICRGMNHGKGKKAAQDNTSKYVDEWMKKYREEHPGVKTFGFGEDPKQQKLF